MITQKDDLIQSSLREQLKQKDAQIASLERMLMQRDAMFNQCFV